MVGRIAELLGQLRDDPDDVAEIAKLLRVLPKGQTKVPPRVIQEMTSRPPASLLARLNSRLGCENRLVDELLALVRDPALSDAQVETAAKVAGIVVDDGSVWRAAMTRGLSQEHAAALLDALRRAAEA